MSIYTIRQARGCEYSKIQHFLDTFWKKGHSLVKSKPLLDFQHYNIENDLYSYIIAVNNETSEIDALEGYITTAQYDSSLKEQGDYWGAIWKKRDDINNEESNDIGMEVFMRIFESPDLHSFAAIGISKIAKKIYKAFQCKIGYLHQFYVLNENKTQFNIAGNVLPSYIGTGDNYIEETGWRIITIEGRNICRLSLKSYYRPFKTIQYFVNRYVNHPIYHYEFLGVYKNEELISLWAYRTLDVNGDKVIRVVDVLGKLEGSLYSQLQLLLQRSNSEYLDILNYGISPELFEKMGFRELDLSGSLILPNYYEPFEQSNVKIEVAVKSDYDNYVAFKGDSDQDRPNIL